MQDFSIPIRVYVEDTDAGGIVYYVNYLKYMERARTELLRTLGYDKPAVFEHNLMFVVKTAAVSYEKPALLDDQLLATAKLIKVGRASFVLDQKVFRQSGEEAELICSGEVKIACVSQQSQTPSAIPDEMYQHLKSTIR